MFIKCAKCNTCFIVPEQAIPESGRKVKCSKCANIWVAYKAITSPDAKNASIVTSYRRSLHNKDLPALSDVKINFILYLLPILLAIAILLMSSLVFPKYFEKNEYLNTICSSIMLCPTSYIKIQDVKITPQQEKQGLLLQYKVYNDSAKTIEMPIIRVRLLDMDKKAVKNHYISSSHLKILPNKYYEVKTEFYNIPKEALQVDISAGNPLELLFD